MASLQLNLAGVDGSEIPGHIRWRREEIAERAASLPGVVAAGMANALPFQEEAWEVFEFRRAGAGTPEDAPLRADRTYVSSGYFAAMGMPLVRGEPLPEQRASGAPFPFVVNETAARQFWPGEDPVGEVVESSVGEGVVVGVVQDVRQLGLAEDPPPAVYFPQVMGPRLLATLVVRTSGDPQALAGPVGQVIQDIDRGQPIRRIATLEDVMADSIAQDRFFTLLFAAFGGLALLLGAVGIYGVLAYSVTQRTREIGVRMALGARATDVLRSVVGAGMTLVMVGIVLGTAAALVITRVLESQLYGISATDPIAFTAALGFLAVVALLGCYLPAARAANVDPMAALREE